MYAADQARTEEPAETAQLAVRRMLLWYLHTSNNASARLAPDARHLELVELDAGISTMTFATHEDASEWYETEKMSLVAATRAADEMTMYDLAWQLPATLYPIYAHRCQFDDWVATSLVALGATRQSGDRYGEAEILESLGKAHIQAMARQVGIEYQTAALAIRRELGDRVGEMTSTNAIGLARLRWRELDQALALFEQTNAIADELQDDYWTAISLNNIANVYVELERFDEAQPLLRRAVALHRQLGMSLEGDALRGLSHLYRRLGQPEEANRHILEALTIARLKENRAWEGFWLIEHGRVLLDLGNPSEALTSFQRAARLQRQLGDRIREADALDATGEAYQHLDRYQEAAGFHRLSAATFGELGENWRRAMALDHLATAVSAGEGNTEAETYWREALTLLAEYGDPRSRRVRTRINELLEGS
jgi:tetratricopeptide (TPR) repeat protein